MLPECRLWENASAICETGPGRGYLQPRSVRDKGKEGIMINSYIAIDLETTGLEAKLEKITEIAALRVTDGVITDRLVTLINPKRKLGERITELTGITDEMVADAPPIGR